MMKKKNIQKYVFVCVCVGKKKPLVGVKECIKQEEKRQCFD